MAYDIFQLVLDFQQDPAHFSGLIGPDKPLPEDFGKLLEEVAAMETSGQESDHPEALISATAFFVERVLFMPGGDFYRHLGVDRHATQDQIRKHYHLLMHLFMLDREDMAEDWSAEFADCINRAYSILRDPAKRRKYDIHLAGQNPHVGGGAAKEDGGNSFARSIVSFAKARNVSHSERKSHKAEDVSGEPLLHQGAVSGGAASENIVMNSAVAPIQEEDSFIADSIERAYSDISTRVSSANDAPPQPEAGTAAEMERSDDYPRGGVAPVLVDDDLGSGVEAAYQRRSQSSGTSTRWGIILVLLFVVAGGMAAIYEYQIAPGQLSGLFSRESQTMSMTDKRPEVAPAPAPESESAVVVQEETPATSLERQAPDAGPEEPLPVTVEVPVEEAKQDEETASVVSGLTLSPRRLSQPPQTTAPAPVQKKVETQSSRPVTPAVKKTEKTLPDVRKTNVKPVTVAAAPVAEAVPDLAPDPVPPAERDTHLNAGEVTGSVTTQSSPTPDALPGSEAAVMAGLASLPHPPPAMETESPQVKLIPQETLDSLMRVFVRSYEEGDLKRLLSVFAQDAHTNDRTDRNGIAKDYRELFEVTEKRQFIIDDLTWAPVNEERARGEGAFEVKVLLKGETSITTVRGQVKIDVEKRGREFLITRFFHSYE